MIYFILGCIVGCLIAAVIGWLFDKPGRESRDRDQSWQDGFNTGTNDYHADWMFALDDVIPDAITIGPMAVRRYITTLQQELERAHGSH